MSVTEKVFKILQINRISLHEPARVPHKQRVTRLYKAILKNTNDWLILREQWLEKASGIQKIFKERAKETNPRLIEQYVDEGEKWLHRHRHPDPYTPIYMFGGTMYQRNAPLPDYVRLSNPPTSSSIRCPHS